MNAQTESALAVFEKGDWFGHVGVKETETGQMVSSWQEAMKYCDSVDGRNFVLYGTNQLGGQVLARSPSRDKQWNDTVRGLQPAVKPLVKRKLEKVVQENNLSFKALDRIVYGHILGACMELEFSDVVNPGFFASIAYWYFKGHLPCGGKEVMYRRPKVDAEGRKHEGIDLYPPGFYDPIAKWYETGDFGDWQGQIPPPGKLIVY